VVERALVLHRTGKLADAELLYRSALATNASDAEALRLLGVLKTQQGRHGEALELASDAVRLQPGSAKAHSALGSIQLALSRYEESMASYRTAATLEPDVATNHYNLGVALQALSRPGDALESFDRALAIEPKLCEALTNRGNALMALNRPVEAASSFEGALALRPGFPEALVGLGTALYAVGRHEEALADYDRALSLRPDSPKVLLNRGIALYALQRFADALASFDGALALAPGSAEILQHRGNVLQVLGRHRDALESVDKALAIDPGLASAHCIRAKALDELGHRAEALASLERAIAINPEHAEARWSLVMCQLAAGFGATGNPADEIAEFAKGLDELDRWFEGDRLKQGVDAVGAFAPFYLAYHENNNRELLRRYGRLCTRIMSTWLERRPPGQRSSRPPSSVLRVGVVSAHFHDHSVWTAIVKGWFQRLDRARFSLHAFHLGTTADQETLAARSCAIHFEQGRRSLEQWVDTIAGQHLDILIYPEIGMDVMTVKLAAMRLAPVQIASWGHPETTGLPTIDYFVSAQDMEPEGAAANYTEQLVALPHLGCLYRPSGVSAEPAHIAALGIAQHTPILLCPGTPFKYAPRYDRVLVEIARQLGQCTFIFFAIQGAGRVHDLSARLHRRLGDAFSREGLDSSRFVALLPWQSRPSFHGLMMRADVCLDTIGFSGFNTAMQAVECGLPIVAWEGRFLRGRLASGIMKRIGLPELVAGSESDYIGLAVRLCRDTDFRASMRERIEAGRNALFKDEVPIRAFEDFLALAAGRGG
jgi:protein O-GlcNAc transferase